MFFKKVKHWEVFFLKPDSTKKEKKKNPQRSPKIN